MSIDNHDNLFYLPVREEVPSRIAFSRWLDEEPVARLPYLEDVKAIDVTLDGLALSLKEASHKDEEWPLIDLDTALGIVAMAQSRGAAEPLSAVQGANVIDLDLRRRLGRSFSSSVSPDDPEAA